MAYRVRQGRDFVIPPTGLSYTGSFLYQMDHLGQRDYVPNPVLEKALDVLFLVHADHELNASWWVEFYAHDDLKPEADSSQYDSATNWKFVSGPILRHRVSDSPVLNGTRGSLECL